MLDKKWFLILHPFDPTIIIPVIKTTFVLFLILSQEAHHQYNYLRLMSNIVSI
jgi:hypothetical protein